MASSGERLREKEMKAGLISYKQALLGEDKLDQYQKEIARVCALLNWDAARQSPQDISDPRAWIIGSAECGWNVVYVNRDFFQILRCTFMHNGQPVLDWSPEKGIKLLYQREKFFDVPRAHANLQLLADAMCEKYVGVRQTFLELQRIAKE